MGISVIGCGDYHALMQDRAAKCKIPFPPTSFEYFNQQLLDIIAKYDPIHNASRFENKALLILEGELDRLVPSTCNQEFINVLQSTNYALNPQLFSVFIEPGAKHQFTPMMQDKAISWIHFHLSK